MEDEARKEGRSPLVYDGKGCLVENLKYCPIYGF